MPLPSLKPGKNEQQNKAALKHMKNDLQYGENAA
jgi:hypothetical protein